MIYIQQVGIINFKEDQFVDIKSECKKVAPKFIRRTDSFIQLAILGVEQVQRGIEIPNNSALYLTSGQGNTGVFQRLCEQRFIEKSPPKPVDFINSLSNTAGFYISQFLNLNSKNSNFANHGFVVEMALLLAESDLHLGQEESVLLGGVDHCLQPKSFAVDALGLNKQCMLGEGSNWMLLNSCRENALASIAVLPETFNLAEVAEFIDRQPCSIQLAFALRTPESAVNSLLLKGDNKRFIYEHSVGFYETVVLYALNSFVQSEAGKLIFIDYFEGSYRLLELNVFKSP